jgi:purine nucleosidase
MTSPPISILLDTDIGTNIDDALALAYLLREPSCELVGITTVTGDVQKRAACAAAVCRAAGRPDMPIHCGCSDPLPPGLGQPGVPLYEAIRGLPHDRTRPAHTAFDFLRNAIRSRPGEITLVSIGPFTNLATLFAADPQIPRLLRQLVSMAGDFSADAPRAETNCRVDPVAAEIVFRSDVPRHVVAGMNVTTSCRLASDQALRLIEGMGLDPLARMATLWSRGRSELFFHDPLAAALAFHPELCSTECGTVFISLSGDAPERGESTFTPGDGRTFVATAVDVDRFFEEFFGGPIRLPGNR